MGSNESPGHMAENTRIDRRDDDGSRNVIRLIVGSSITIVGLAVLGVVKLVEMLL